MATDLSLRPPIQRICVQSPAGVKKLCDLLPLCPEPVEPSMTCVEQPECDLGAPGAARMHRPGNSDSGYCSHSFVSNGPLYPISGVSGTWGRRNPRYPKSSSRWTTEDTENAENIMVQPLPPEPIEPSVSGDLYSTAKQSTISSHFSPDERPSTSGMSAGVPGDSGALYATLRPRTHDPRLPSTSDDLYAPIRRPSKLIRVSLPPGLLRTVNTNSKVSGHKLRLCLKLTDSDFTNPRISFDGSKPGDSESFDEPLFSVTFGSHLIHSEQAYHTVFPAHVGQADLCAQCLPEALQTVFNGQDASVMYFGALSPHKQAYLYNRSLNSASNNGLFVAAVQWTFQLIEEFRAKRSDVRYSVRVSALHYSQKTDELTDLLADFGAAVDEGPVRCNEDPSIGVVVDNRTEVRVETMDQALFFLDRVREHRFNVEAENQRSCHTLFYLTLYRYQTEPEGVQSGKSRLCLIDLGLGEKNSKTGFMTMPVLGNILLAIFQGQKHLPSRQNTLCRLLKESVGAAKNKRTVLLSSFAPVEGRCPVETENLIQLAVKMHKIVRKNASFANSRKSSKALEDLSVRKDNFDASADCPSSSEQSCAETVIYCGHNNASALEGHCEEVNDADAVGSTIPTLVPIPIDCPPGAVVHASLPLHRPLHPSCSMPSTHLPDSRPQRQTSVPTDLVLCNPMTHLPHTGSPKGTLRRSHKQREIECEGDFWNIDPEKREMVLNWVIEQKVEFGTAEACGGGKTLCTPSEFLLLPGAKVDSAVQVSEAEIDSELLHVWNQARFLDDIVEDDEEPSTTTDLQILSKACDVFADRGETAKEPEPPQTVDCELDRAMAASISSIKSHEILSRMVTEFPDSVPPGDSLNTSVFTESKAPTEMDFYRRASHLEAYALERLRELESTDKKPDPKNILKTALSSLTRKLDCLEPMGTSVISEDSNPPTRKFGTLICPKLDRKESLFSRLRLRQLACCANPMTTSVTSSVGTNTVHSSLASSPLKNVHVAASRSNERHEVSPLPPAVARQITDQLRAGLHSSVSGRTEKSSRRQKCPKQNSVLLSPEPAWSSGHGSDETASIPSPPALFVRAGTRSTVPNGVVAKTWHRESFSASSGYESADYGKSRALASPPQDLIKGVSPQLSAEIHALRQLRDSLKVQLGEARKRLGLSEEVVLEDDSRYLALGGEVVVDILKQETHQLNKKLTECKSRIMLITTFL